MPVSSFRPTHSMTSRIQDAYAKEFHLFKPDKKLHWLPHLGTISLDIELQDRTVSAEVPPLEAAIIEHFSTRGAYHVLPSSP